MRPLPLVSLVLFLGLTTLIVLAQSEDDTFEDLDGLTEGYVGPEDPVSFYNAGAGIVAIISSSVTVRPGMATVTTQVGEDVWTIAPSYIAGPQQTVVGAYQKIGNIDSGPGCIKIQGGPTYGSDSNCDSFSSGYEAALAENGLKMAGSAAETPSAPTVTPGPSSTLTSARMSVSPTATSQTAATTSTDTGSSNPGDTSAAWKLIPGGGGALLAVLGGALALLI